MTLLQRQVVTPRGRRKTRAKWASSCIPATPAISRAQTRAFQRIRKTLDPDVEVQRACAGGLDRSGSVAADQAQPPVAGAHPGPGQRVIEEPFGIDPDVLPMRRTDADQRRQVPQRIPGPLDGQIGRIGRAVARTLPGMGLDQLPACEQLHQLTVGPSVPDPDGVTTFRTYELRPGWVPPIRGGAPGPDSRGQRCATARRSELNGSSRRLRIAVHSLTRAVRPRLHR